MKHIKDFFYDKNDIFIALIILALAAGLIFWRMNVIMDYPKTLAENPASVSAEQKEDPTPKPPAQSSTPDQNTGSLWADGKLTNDVTVTISGGTATEAVQHLVDAGLFASYDEFAGICSAAGYAPDQIKATTFTFSAGSTQTDIAKQVTI